ncbi:MAG: hypothetical protein IT290_13470, partial [Deltaproteobacteria bacterium]|nr:hypothetical protein [Deltaproteobacteria bacterium]
MTFRNAIRGLAARSSSIALVACSPFASFGDANAQVVYSAGVQAIYDDNIFLEGDNPVPLAAAGTEGIPLEILDE